MSCAEWTDSQRKEERKSGVLLTGVACLTGESQRFMRGELFFISLVLILSLSLFNIPSRNTLTHLLIPAFLPLDNSLISGNYQQYENEEARLGHSYYTRSSGGVNYLCGLLVNSSRCLVVGSS